MWQCAGFARDAAVLNLDVANAFGSISRQWMLEVLKVRGLSAAFYAAYGFTGAFGRNLCKFTFPQRWRNLRKSLLDHKTYGRKRAKKTALKITLANA